jgi:hypothetical protein
MPKFYCAFVEGNSRNLAGRRPSLSCTARLSLNRAPTVDPLDERPLMLGTRFAPQ